MRGRTTKGGPSSGRRLAEAAEAGRGETGEARLLDRNGARPDGGVGFAVSRGGGVIGDHEVRLIGEHEMLTLSHRAFDRGLFAAGAVAAARWIAGRTAGRYSMKDVLGL